ncbi:C-GCAxxG-C-C family protein [Proteiniclasticum sp.]|uniref:C-GCAxxG-C-C family protein n=1 Tax=Proteiniclasticum sp. TaxID=2053595 RepID=UPI00289FC149|nr:C-GCAxxG-C-C family protein [Proteiniclasticum sp.]
MSEVNSTKVYSRRDMLKTAGKAAVGVAAVAVIPSFLTGCDKKVELPSKEVLAYEYMPASTDAPAYPYPYQKLDVATSMERGYAGYYNKGGCCRGVIDAVIGQLGDKAGYPWNQIPVDVFANGATGFGAGSLCGALAGAATCIGFSIPPEDAPKVTAELFKWYTSTELPVYQPDVDNEALVSKSVNCLDSVGQFLEVSGHAMGDPERKARCAGLTADAAGKVVELINAYYNL